MKRLVPIFFGIVCLFGFSSVAFADEQGLDLCEEQGEAFGNGRGVDYISPVCFDRFLSVSSAAAVKSSSDGKVLAFGYRNILYIKKTEDNSSTISIIAGSSTELKSIVAVAIDDTNKEIAVLESSGDVLFFSQIITGNVSPYRVLKSDKLLGANDLEVDPIKNEVIITNKSTSSILFFSRLANIHAIEGKRKLSLIRSILDPVSI